jgi:hypothetical protein
MTEKWAKAEREETNEEKITRKSHQKETKRLKMTIER